jgi:hypothetical protein
MMNCNYSFKGKNVAGNVVMNLVQILSESFVDKNIMAGF